MMTKMEYVMETRLGIWTQVSSTTELALLFYLQFLAFEEEGKGKNRFLPGYQPFNGTSTTFLLTSLLLRGMGKGKDRFFSGC